MARLLEIEDLQDFLHRKLDPAAATIAIKVATGWLVDATRIADWPYPVPDEIFAWAVELAAIAWSNPEGLSTLAVGDVSRGWALTRKAEILTAARERYRGNSGGPLFNFPPAQPYPAPWAAPRVTR